MFSPRWLEMLAQHGGPHLSYRTNPASGKMCIFKDGAPFMTPTPAMSDDDLRIRRMDEAGVDVAIVSLTCPNVFFGSGEISLAAARDNNDPMAEAQSRYPDRIRWFASLPWQFAELAVAELQRSLSQGASGVVVLGNIAGQPLTDPLFAPVWPAIDDRALPVFIQPTAPPGVAAMGMDQSHLTPPGTVDPMERLAPVVQLGSGPLVIFAQPGLGGPGSDRPGPGGAGLATVIALARARPDELTYGANNTTSAHYLISQLLQRHAGIRMRHIPYAGTAAGRIDLLFGQWSGVDTETAASGARLLAVTTARRFPALPAVPAVAETLPGFDQAVSYGLMAHEQTPPRLVALLAAAADGALRQPDLQKRLIGAGSFPAGGSPADFAALIGRQREGSVR